MGKKLASRAVIMSLTVAAWPGYGADKGDTLAEVVVTADRATTATKTDAKLIETPQAISVITAEQIMDRGARLIEEAVRYSAGVTAEPYGLDSRNASTAIRGFPSVEYLDGMRRIWGFLNFARTDMYTLERLEVLRGPSSVLYGAGTAGGLVNQVSKRPQFERSAQVGVQYGSYDRKQLQFDMTGALDADDTFAGRLIGVAREADAQVDFSPDDHLLVAPSLRWRVGESTDITLLGSWTQDRLDSYAQVPPLAATLFAPPGRRLPDSFYGGEPGFNDYNVDQTAATLLLDHSFSDNVKLGSAARYVDSRTKYHSLFLDSFTDRDPSTAQVDPFLDEEQEVMARFFEIGDQRAAAFTTDHKLQLNATTGAFSHTVLVGVDYQWFRQRTDLIFGDASPLNIYSPAYGTRPQATPERQPTQWVSQVGVYVQDQIKYADRVFVVLGARRDNAKTRLEGAPEQVDKENTFRAAVIVDVGGGFSPYVSYAESFLPVAGTNLSGVPFVPQLGTQYEVGVKWQPASRTLVTLAAFDVRETNRFTNHPTDAFDVVQQGEVRSRGAELEVSYEIPYDFNVFASYSYINAEISESNTPAEVGVQIDTTPEHQATVWGVKTFPVGDYALRIGAGARYVGESLSGGTLHVPDYSLVDALIGLESQQWSFTVNASNLMDKRHYATCLVRGDCWIGPRRNVIGSMTYKF